MKTVGGMFAVMKRCRCVGLEHDTTSKNQLELSTQNGRAAHAAVEWRASIVAERAARSPARSPGRGLLPVRLSRRSACGCGTR